MKASLTLRDEKSPLIRMKFPVTVAGFSLASGIVLGDSEDLSLHLGTSPETCPSVKIAYRPNLPSSSLSLVVKAGIGPWGPPRTAALSLSAEVRFSRAASGPFFTVHVKPRVGDFSLRNIAKLASFGAVADTSTPKIDKEGGSLSNIGIQSPWQNRSQSFPCASPESGHLVTNLDEASNRGIFDDVETGKRDVSGSSHTLIGDAPALTPLHLDKSFLFTPMPYRGQPFNGMHVGISEEAESVDNWANDYVKIEGSEKSGSTFQAEDRNICSKDREDRTSKVDNFRDSQSHSQSSLHNSIGGASCTNEPDSVSMIKTIDFFPMQSCWRLDEGCRGWTLHAHSTLPLGSNTALKLRWGVNAHRDFLQGWDSQLPRVKLPYLYLQKVSVSSMDVSLESCKQGGLSCDAQMPLLTRYEECHELSPVAALCYSLKHRLQLLHAENQVLTKAMEEMKAQFEQRSNGNQRRLAVNRGDAFAEGTTRDISAGLKGDSKEVSIKSYQKRGGVGLENGKHRKSNSGLDALKKLSGFGRRGNGK